MKVHHLNCGTMTPMTGTMVAHVLLVETADGLVLVDTGFGARDIDDPGRRLGPLRHVIRPALSRAETALEQVERLGFDRTDGRHLGATPFDLDHVGGLADFPHATVHTTAAEAAAVMSPTLKERVRYRRAQLGHGPNIVGHEPTGEPWRGFAGARELGEIAPGIVLVPLPGHTRGHACVAVDAGHRWVLHCGDAFYDPATLHGTANAPVTLRVMETLFATSRRQVRDNHARLAELARAADPELLIVCAHDAEQLRRAQASE